MNIDFSRVITAEQKAESQQESMARRVDTERDRRMDAGVMFNGTLFQSRPNDRENIAGAAQLAFMAIVAGAQPGDLYWHGGTDPFVWIAMDNSLVPMDAQTTVDFAKVAAAYKQELTFAARSLKDSVPVPEDFADDRWWPNGSVSATATG